MKICIFGAGGFAQEVYWLAKQCGREVDAFIDINPGGYWYNTKIESEDYFDPSKHQAVVAVANPKVREKIVHQIQNRYGMSCFTTLISPSANLMSDDIAIAQGTIICANCIITCDVSLGFHTQLNLATTIGHNTKVGDYFTTAPGVHISGKVLAGRRVYMGTNSSTIEDLQIADDITIGAGACVTKSLLESGTYVGTPAKKLEKRNG
jgi:sugar O-acyltransferase (sialic acid O-acetyltransferase NeuD family)